MIFLLILGGGVGVVLATTGPNFTVASVCIAIAALILATIVSNAVNIADQWEKAVVLRLGKFRALNGPGLFLIVPIIETVPYWIDTRVITSNFKAGENTYQRYGSGGRRCCALLASGRPEEIRIERR